MKKRELNINFTDPVFLKFFILVVIFIVALIIGIFIGFPFETDPMLAPEFPGLPKKSLSFLCPNEDYESCAQICEEDRDNCIAMFRGEFNDDTEPVYDWYEDCLEIEDATSCTEALEALLEPFQQQLDNDIKSCNSYYAPCVADCCNPMR